MVPIDRGRDLGELSLKDGVDSRSRRNRRSLIILIFLVVAHVMRMLKRQTLTIVPVNAS